MIIRMVDSFYWYFHSVICVGACHLCPQKHLKNIVHVLLSSASYKYFYNMPMFVCLCKHIIKNGQYRKVLCGGNILATTCSLQTCKEKIHINGYRQ